MVKNGNLREKETQPCEKRKWWRLVGNKWMSVTEDRIASQLFRVPINRALWSPCCKRKFWEGASCRRAESVTLCHERVSFPAQNEALLGRFTELNHEQHQGEILLLSLLQESKTCLGCFCLSSLRLGYWMSFCCLLYNLFIIRFFTL